jgi:hypothetical protein
MCLKNRTGKNDDRNGIKGKKSEPVHLLHEKGKNRETGIYLLETGECL